MKAALKMKKDTFMSLRVALMLLILTPLSAFSSTQFRVIVDASGSMIINDPDRLTAESLRLIADLAPQEEASLGVWLFGEEPRILLPETIITDDVAERLKNSLGEYETQDVQTDLESVLTLILDTPTPEGIDPEAQQHWILVTDGVVDISLDAKVNEASRNRILKPILEKLVERDIHLHAVSVTGNTDETLLKELAVQTNASFTEVSEPDDLLGTFNRIFTMANTPDEVAFDGNSFMVDASIDEFTLLVFHSPSTDPRIITPSNNALKLEDQDKIRVASSNRYTLVTVKTPEVGKWQVENVDIEKSSIRIVTNLRAEASVITPVLFVNEPLFSDIALYESGTLLNDPVILELVRAQQNLIKLNDDGTTLIHEKQLSQSAFRFKNKLDPILQAGDYELYSFLDGQSFTRKLSQYFSVIPAVSFDIEKKEYDLVAFTIKPAHLRLNALRSRVMLEINYASGERFFEEVSLLGIGFWQRIILPKSKNFSARIKLLGVTQTGVQFEYWSPTWNAKEVVDDGSDGKTNVEISKGPISGFGELMGNPDASKTPEENEVTTAVTPTTEPVIAEPIIGQAPTPPETPIVQETIDEAAVETEKTSESSMPATVPEEEEIAISSVEIASYAFINLLVFGLLGGFFWWYRKRKKAAQATDDDVPEVDE